MSLPWLQDDFKESSKSRSRSPVDKTEQTESGPKAPVAKTKTDPADKSSFKISTSRSRSRDKSHHGKRSRDRSSSHSRRSRKSRRHESGRKKRGKTSSSRSSSSSSRSSSSRSSSRSSRSGSIPERIITSNKPQHVNSRIFVANIVSKQVTKKELVKNFSKYGQVMDALLHSKNYAFIQYSKEEHAQLAVREENGKYFKGRVLCVKLASEERKNNLSPPQGERGPDSGPHGFKKRKRKPRSLMDNQRWPSPHGVPNPPFHRGLYGGEFPPPPPDFHGIMPGPPGAGIMPGLPGVLGPIPRDFRSMDPFFRDPPWVAGDPFRNNMPGDVPRKPRQTRPTAECEIFVMNPELRPYGELVERRIQKFSIVAAVSVRPSHMSPVQLLEDLRAQKVLFAIFISSQNELHKSMTLNVLHGSPEEHRNMPLEDAIMFVRDSFHDYVEKMKAKVDAVVAPLMPRLAINFLKPNPYVAYLLNLLADTQSLTVEEINEIIRYLVQRRDKLIDEEGGLSPAKETYHKTSQSSRRTPDSDRRTPEPRHMSPDERDRRSPEETRRRTSEERYHRYLEDGHHRSRRSPEDLRRSPEGLRRSPEDLRRSPGMSRGKSPEDSYNRSSRSYHRSQSPEPDQVKEAPGANKTLLTEDLTSKILSILNSVRNNAQNPPAADTSQQQAKLLPATSTSAPAMQDPEHPPLPPPLPTPPPLPSGEADDFDSSIGQNSQNSMFQSTPGLSTNIGAGFLGNINTSNSLPTSQMGSSGFLSNFGASGGPVYEQGPDNSSWRPLSYDNYGFMGQAMPGMGLEPQGPSGVRFQGNYNFLNMHSQMNQTGQMGQNYGLPKY